jgi:CheY-like chemotaxis protein
MELETGDFDLAGLLRELICLFQPQCEQKKLGLRFEGPESDASLLVSGDEGKLRQVLVNLLGNAVKFTAAGRVTLRATAVGADSWRFEVEDSGAGIAPELRAVVFRPFCQGPQAARNGGTGLGLTIAKRQVELMGGQLELETRDGAGSRFFFTLHLPQSACRLELAKPRLRRVDRLAAGVRVRALVVDDIPENREVLAILLRIVGCEVTLAENGRQAIEIVRYSAPDIVFLDMRLPDLEGVEAARRLVEEFGPTGLKIVATSASALSHQREQYLRVGCDEFVAKPFRADRIYGSIERLLQVRFEYCDDPESGASSDIVDLSSVTLPEELAERLMMAAELHSATVLKACLLEVEGLGAAGQRFAHHLRVFLASYDMATIQHLVAQIPTHPSVPAPDQRTVAA